MKCKDAASFILLREDHPLTLVQSIRLRTHFLICEACCNFEQQTLMMRNVLRIWRNFDNPVEPTPSSSVNGS